MAQHPDGRQRGLTRRQAVGSMAAAGAVAALAGSRHSQAQTARRPNVLFILIDDQRFDAMSNMGHPFLQTPHLDRLAAEGARFENAFVNISLCSPSRACYLTGCEPQRTGVFTNEATDYDHRLPTFATLLQTAGYRTAWVGKWHQEPSADPRPGFDYWFSFRGQGHYDNPPVNENGEEKVIEGYMTDILAERASAWLERLPADEPFCLCLSHKAIHGPFTPADRHKDMYRDVRYPKPPNFDEDFADKPWWLRAAMIRGIRAEQWRQNADKLVPDSIPPAQWNDQQQGAWMDYFRAMLAVDDSVGQMLAALEARGILDDTLIIYTSDNGYFKGEFRRGDKRLAYEASMRIPMLVRYPRLVAPGSRVAPMALNLDVCPTILDVCGVAPPEVVHGRSLRPLLTQPDQKPAGWREDFLFQYFREAWLMGLPNMQAVRTEKWKYIVSPDYPDQPELYDLEHDPHELDNLAGQPQVASVQTALAARLAELLAAAEASRLPAPPPPPTAVLARYQLTAGGAEVRDLSGHNRHGTATQAPASEVDGRLARVFDGAARVDFDPKVGPPVHGGPFWLIAQFRAEAGDGVIVSHGGQSNGYSLELVGGRPTFLVRGGGGLHTVQADQLVTGRWVTVAGILDVAGHLRIVVDGVEAAVQPGGVPPAALPNNGLCFGHDPDSRVGEGEAQPYRGALAEVIIGGGAMPEGDLAPVAAAPAVTAVGSVEGWYKLTVSGHEVTDSSAHQRHGTATAAPASLVDGRPARIFAEGSSVLFEPDASPPIAAGPFFVTVALRAEGPDGVVVSQGGATNGFSLELVDGRPAFYVRSRNQFFELRAPEPVTGRWVTLTGSLDRQGVGRIVVDGQEVARATGWQPLAAKPNESLVFGGDPATRVGPLPAQPYRGALAEVILGLGSPEVVNQDG